jgi:hypothetical protein
MALAETVTSLGRVRAVQERVLPPFGADGKLVEVIERNRMHILGSTGYSQDFLDVIEGSPSPPTPRPPPSCARASPRSRSHRPSSRGTSPR